MYEGGNQCADDSDGYRHPQNFPGKHVVDQLAPVVADEAGHKAESLRNQRGADRSNSRVENVFGPEQGKREDEDGSKKCCAADSAQHGTGGHDDRHGEREPVEGEIHCGTDYTQAGRAGKKTFVRRCEQSSWLSG